MFITKISIANIKGKDKWYHDFNDFCSNKINIFVAPNGFGKSTLTTAFKAATQGKMKLNKNECFEENPANEPSLELVYKDKNTIKTIRSDYTKGEISNHFVIHCINNPVYAKSTGRNIGNGVHTKSAELLIEDIKICKVPEKLSISYSIRDIKNKLHSRAPNINNFFSSIKGLQFIIENVNELTRWTKDKKFNELLNVINSSNCLSVLPPEFEILREKLVENIDDNIDAKEALIQIIFILKNNSLSHIKKCLKSLIYSQRKRDIEYRIEEFNTTGQPIKATEHKGYLTLNLGGANRMSNGERDILYFVSSLIKFESLVETKPALLVIDEIFDYLDGTNLLAAQYYLSKMVSRFNNEKKIVFPIVMTHLDPAVFVNYCMKGMKVHYLTNKSTINDLSSDRIVQLLILRSVLKQSEKKELAANVEKHLLHYYPENWTVSDEIKGVIPCFWEDSYKFRGYLSEEVNNYLNDLEYNALAVVIAIRIKVEEKTVELLPGDKRYEYYEKHGADKKLSYAEENNAQLPEEFYLLCPLYNDTAHLRNKADIENRNKIESAYLKISTKAIKQIIKNLFKE